MISISPIELAFIRCSPPYLFAQTFRGWELVTLRPAKLLQLFLECVVYMIVTSRG